ncbi:MAG: winged helix DNA-binding domain-containing protein [Chloroflexota bacterium]|nr:winged helix DNA-binding domain-containing protein [Chloroflexota bacterium]MDE2909852.1 winged helix DNA-binding domain-containing protein [Chloroflexota bacterium]
MTQPIPVTRETVKRLSVYKQGLHQRPASSGQAALKRIIERIGLLQLDSISVVARSHYLVMLARAGLYDPAQLDALLTNGFLFETWAHAMCQLPTAHYPWYHAYIQQKQLKESQWQLDRLDIDMAPIIEHVLEAIRGRGPLSSKDFESERRGDGGWWNWKPTKVALEFLFDYGELMVSHRVKFQRYYDLPERVLDHSQFALDKSIEDFRRWTIERGLRHIGIGTSNHVADYYRQYKRDAAAILGDMVGAGTALPVVVEGWKGAAFIHHEDLPLLEAVQAGEHEPRLTQFLSPFDNLFWDRDRDEMLWDFFYRIEVYTPKAKRVYGYYVMPILHGAELIGRIDPKVERKRKRLIFNNLHLERGVKLNGALYRGLFGAIEEFMAFHGCDSFDLRQCNRAPLARRLRKHFA